MREFLSQVRFHTYAQSISRHSGDRLHAAAVGGAFALIATVVFGTLSYHPF